MPVTFSGPYNKGYFLAYGFNPVSISRSEKVVVFAEGGCNPWNWEVDDENLSFAIESTEVPYNTLAANNSLSYGDSATITITDDYTDLVATGTIKCCAGGRTGDEDRCAEAGCV